jgi:hypothetical protein
LGRQAATSGRVSVCIILCGVKCFWFCGLRRELKIGRRMGRVFFAPCVTRGGREVRPLV